MDRVTAIEFLVLFCRGALLFEIIDLRIHHPVMQRGRKATANGD